MRGLPSILLRFCPVNIAFLSASLLAISALANGPIASISTSNDVEAQSDSETEGSIKFNRDIRPILSTSCFPCHGPDGSHREADLRLDQAENALADRGGYAAIVPRDLESSEAWQRIITDDSSLVMPPVDAKEKLAEEDKVVLRKWIEQGAPFEGHWSFIRPEQSPLPDVDHPRFATHAIDRFVYRRMIESGLTPSPRATKEILLRRVTFDLTGLPPTIEEIENFVGDTSPDAYEKVVDRLLNSPRFGERMAVDWLDAARYGDTSVFHADGPRDMWVWRDWVVDAFNRNLPFDEFTIHQLAGDQLPDATWREKVATGFLRNNATTDEGGAIAEEFRVEYAVDRVKTTSLVWLGLSMECAQCHAHKYDPISQEDYYRFFAFFNQSADPGMQTRNGNQTPVVEVPDLNDARHIPTAEAELQAMQERLEKLAQEAHPAFREWLAMASRDAESKALPADELSYLPLESTGEDAAAKQLLDTHASNEDQAASAGQLEGEAKFVSGRFGQAIQTNGQSYASFPLVGDLERDQSFTVSVWAKSENAATGAPVARMDVANGHRGYDILLGGSEIEVHLIHAWPENALKVEAKVELPAKTWNHYCFTYDGSQSAGGIVVYLNGQPLEHRAEQDSLSGSIRTESPLLIGRRSQGGEFNGHVDEVRIFSRALTAEEVKILSGMSEIQDLLRLADGDRTDNQMEKLNAHFLQTIHEPYMETAKAIDAQEKRLAELRQPLSTVMIMQDVEQPRPTYMLRRGQYDSPDEDHPVEPGTPSVLPPLPAQQPTNRLALARWMVSDENPLTARVTVNRFWQKVFGTGIVKTVEDFGSQGEWPSHPELLDWLAVDFVDHGWDIKRLIKQLVLSETYQQSSRINAEHLATDPQNRLLARGPRFRLTAEMVRDQALAVSGLLTEIQGGPSVKPYQPPGLWSEVSLNPGVRFTQDHGASLYRRSLYIYWKRSSPPPSMLIFDAPTREKCSLRRDKTNTPLQALVLMNDPQYLEAARAMAEHLLSDSQLSDDERMIQAYRSVTSRYPNPEVSQLLHEQLEQARQRYRTDPESAQQLLSQGEHPINEELPPDEHAAWMILCSLLLNLDETITRG